MGDYLSRLAVALPLILMLAVAILLLWRRQGGQWPNALKRAAPTALPTDLDIRSVKSLTPTARLAIVHFDGRDHLIGIHARHINLLVSAPSTTTLSAAPQTFGEETP